ncbi:unnamed protein product [Closterium sp. NIES-64]|nr:unnamed protein product [Closterium sp. NIES-64]
MVSRNLFRKGEDLAVTEGNGTVFAHVYFAKSGYSPDPTDQLYERSSTFSKTHLAYYPRPKVDTRKRLLGGGSDANDTAGEPPPPSSKAAADSEEKGDATAVVPEEVEWIGFWKPNLTISLIDDFTAKWIQSDCSQPDCFPCSHFHAFPHFAWHSAPADMTFDEGTGNYFPMLHTCPTVSEVPLSLVVETLPLWRWQIYLFMDQSPLAVITHPPFYPLPALSTPHSSRPDMTFDEGTGNYFPTLHMNEFWLLRDKLLQLNATVSEVPLSLVVETLPLWRWQIYLSMDQSFKIQQQFGTAMESESDELKIYLSMDQSFKLQQQFGTAMESECDELKRVFLEGNPILLGITVVVSLLHSVFDFFAFKNDIAFWNQNKSMEGLSARSVVINFVCQLIIFLYLLDNNTSWLILISSAISCGIEFWKIGKAMHVEIDRSGTIPWLRFRDRESYARNKTKEYDALAMRYFSYVLYPLVAGYAVYSLIYETHKSWYSWVLNSLTGCVYTFGFIMMCPQLFINYKLKSVAHLPWRQMTYKFLNTIVDDLFAFVIKMPTLHRLSPLHLPFPHPPSPFPILLPLSPSSFPFPHPPSPFPILLPLSPSSFPFPHPPSPFPILLPLSPSSFPVPHPPSPFPSSPRPSCPSPPPPDIIFLIFLYQRWIYPVDKKRVNEFGFGGEPEGAALTAAGADGAAGGADGAAGGGADGAGSGSTDRLTAAEAEVAAAAAAAGAAAEGSEGRAGDNEGAGGAGARAVSEEGLVRRGKGKGKGKAGKGGGGEEEVSAEEDDKLKEK